MQPAAKPVPVQQIGPHIYGLRTDEEFNEFMTNNKAKPVSFKVVLSVVWVQRFPQVASPSPGMLSFAGLQVLVQFGSTW